MKRPACTLFWFTLGGLAVEMLLAWWLLWQTHRPARNPDLIPPQNLPTTPADPQ